MNPFFDLVAPQKCECGAIVPEGRRWPLCDRCRAEAVARDKAHRATLHKPGMRCIRCRRGVQAKGDVTCEYCRTFFSGRPPKREKSRI